MANISLSQVKTEGKYDFRSIYEADHVTLEAEDDSPFSNLISDCDYEPEEFNKKVSGLSIITSKCVPEIIIKEVVWVCLSEKI